MDYQTIKQISQINSDFYKKINHEFDQSRQHYWPGWYQLLPFIENFIAFNSKQNRKAQIIDIGCGNGRFAQFCLQNLETKNWNYLGLDNSSELLESAKKQLSKKSYENQISFQEFDLIEWLLKATDLSFVQSKNPAIITCFGVTHHIPDRKTRRGLVLRLSELASSLAGTQQGRALICISFWQFLDENRFRQKIIDPSLVGIGPGHLEENDFILDWQRGKTAYRYAHHWSDGEIDLAIQDKGKLERTETQSKSEVKNKSETKTKVKAVADFRADSKSQTANRYIVLEI